jgi:hypothetical protein
MSRSALSKTVLLPALAAGATVAVVLGVVLVGSHHSGAANAGGSGGGGKDLRLLRIGTYPAQISGDGNGRYVLKGTLPIDPTKGIVWELGKVSDGADRAAALAKALGLHGDVVHDDQGWVVKDGEAEVRVYDAPGSPWGFASSSLMRGCAPIPPEGYQDLRSATACAIDWAMTTPSVSEADARLAAAPIFTAAGLDSTGVAVQGEPPLRTLDVTASVDGVSVGGYDTIVEVGDKGVSLAGGWLAPAEKALTAVGTYPLRTAQAAFDGLQSFAIPEIACVPTAKCPDMGPVDVTGATYGLMPAYEDGNTPLIVPAWLFSVTGGGTGPIQGAVDGSYLADPKGENPGGVVGTSPGSTGSGGGSTGSGGGGAVDVPPPATTTPATGGPDPLPSGAAPQATTAPYGVSPATPITIPKPPVEPQGSPKP